MKTLRRVLTGILFCSFALSAGGQLNSSKVDWRITQVVEKVKADPQGMFTSPSGIHSSILSKFSGAEPVYSIIAFASSIEEAAALGIQPRSFNGKLFTAYVTYDQLVELSNASTVSFIAAPRKLYPKLDKSLVDMKVDKVHTGQVNGTPYKGSGVIVGVIDSGIDWKHQDFRLNSDTTKSRLLFLRDLTTGKEFTKAQIDNELDGTPANVVDEVDISGHGTHVASIAAGDGSASNGTYTGVAPEADLIIVKAGDESFDSDKIIDGVAYIREKAVALGKKFVINLSLGGHDGAHDGTSSEEIAIDQELNDSTGRQIVIAAGNEGADSIHVDGTIAQSGSKQFQFTIPNYFATPGAVNDYVVFSMWYKSGDNLTVEVKTPNNTAVAAVSGQVQQQSTTQGRVNIFNAQDGINPLNNSKECYIEIFDATAGSFPAVGIWTVTITGASISQDGSFDIWLYSSSMGAEITTGATFHKLVGMPGTVDKGITVGSYVTKWNWLSLIGSVSYVGSNRTNNYSLFSSVGPTRDGRQKPDVSAPGQAIAAAMSRSTAPSTQVQVAPAGKYLIEQGTSMAAPHVTGLVALMLQAKPALTAAEIRSKLNSTALKDAFTGASASAQWGNGKVDAEAVLQNVLSVKRESNAMPGEFALMQNYPNPFNPATKIRFRVRGSDFTSLKVFDILGREVAVLLNEKIDAGEYSVLFDASNLTTGVYFYTLKGENHSVTKKMMLVR